MKILHSSDGKLQWKEATWDGNNYRFDNSVVTQTSIFAVRGLSSSGYVKCSYCGAILRNTPKEIAKHKDRANTSTTCFNCSNCVSQNSAVKSEKYTKLDNGKYLITKKTESKLVCKVDYYNRRDIDSEAARQHCSYLACMTATYPVLKDFFHIYPGAFDELITVDKILENGYRDRYSRVNETQYTIKAINTIVAHVNKQNIITHFTVKYKNESAQLIYSSKYNKFFVFNGNSYIEWNPHSWYWPEEVQDRIKRKIASLYN